MAFSLEYIFLDEPTSMLDLSIQAYMLDRIMKKVRKENMAAAFITHDFDIADLLTERAYFLHRGQMVSEGKTDEVLKSKDTRISALVDAWRKQKTMFFDCEGR